MMRERFYDILVHKAKSNKSNSVLCLTLLKFSIKYSYVSLKLQENI